MKKIILYLLTKLPFIVFITTINPNNLDLNNKIKHEEGWIKGIRKVRNC